jgi:hypothetical protein
VPIKLVANKSLQSGVTCALGGSLFTVFPLESFKSEGKFSRSFKICAAINEISFPNRLRFN